jgi:GT2 family glycosyltransferase
MRPQIGAAGARLDGPNGRLLDAGIVLDPVGIVGAPVLAADDQDPGYRGQYHLARTVSAVSGNCLAVRREAFLAVGGFTPEAGDYAAVDLCLKLAARGLRTVWAPQARLRYTIGPAQPTKGADWMRHRWARELGADRYVNPRLKELGEMSHPPQTPRRL